MVRSVVSYVVLMVSSEWQIGQHVGTRWNACEYKFEDLFFSFAREATPPHLENSSLNLSHVVEHMFDNLIASTRHIRFDRRDILVALDSMYKFGHLPHAPSITISSLRT